MSGLSLFFWVIFKNEYGMGGKLSWLRRVRGGGGTERDLPPRGFFSQNRKPAAVIVAATHESGKAWVAS